MRTALPGFPWFCIERTTKTALEIDSVPVGSTADRIAGNVSKFICYLRRAQSLFG